MKVFIPNAEYEKDKNSLILRYQSVFEAQVESLIKKAQEKKVSQLSITLDLPFRKRTLGERSQNHHLNGHIQQIAAETGNAFDVVKCEVKHQAISMGYPILYEGGKEKRDIWGRTMGISEADSSVEECKILIDAVHDLAVLLGIHLDES